MKYKNINININIKNKNIKNKNIKKINYLFQQGLCSKILNQLLFIYI